MVRSKILLIALLLGACTDTKIEVKDRLTVIEPPAALFVCPAMPALPVGAIKDTDNAILIARLAQVGISCHQSLDAIKKNIADQKASIEANKVKSTTTTPR